jgi:hypothetical protein
LLGAVAGGAWELGGQLLSGKSLNEVDWGDVGVEALKGGLLGSGIGATGAAFVEAGGVVAKASVDISIKNGTKTVFNGSKSTKEAIFDGTADVVVGKVVGAVGKKLTGTLEKGLENNLKAETKVASSLIKAQNAFNKITDGGRNLYGARSMIAGFKLDVAKTTSKLTRNALVRSKIAVNVAKGGIGKTVKNATQNSIADRIKGFLVFKNKEMDKLKLFLTFVLMAGIIAGLLYWISSYADKKKTERVTAVAKNYNYAKGVITGIHAYKGHSIEIEYTIDKVKYDYTGGWDTNPHRLGTGDSIRFKYSTANPKLIITELENAY